MFVDLTGHIKDSVVRHLASDPVVTSLVPAEHIYAMQIPSNPTYPFIAYGVPIPTPFVSSCWSGTACRVSIYLYTEAVPDGESGEDQLMRLQSAVVHTMNTFLMRDFGVTDNQYLGSNPSQILPEADRWRSILQFNITAVTAA